MNTGERPMIGARSTNDRTVSLPRRYKYFPKMKVRGRYQLKPYGNTPVIKSARVINSVTRRNDRAGCVQVRAEKKS